MATKNARFLQNLEYYWNHHWSNDERIKLIICGSSASWIINKIINNKGGLYNRITKLMPLEPFDLHQTSKFLKSKKVKLNHHQIIQIYMVTGDVPYYLDNIPPNLSAHQIIERLAFGKQSFFLKEYEMLFASLFEEPDIFIKIVNIIAAHRYGLSQTQLLKLIPELSKGKGSVDKLESLESTGFIQSFRPLFNKKKGVYYRVIDEFVIFYLKWIEPIKDNLILQGMREGYWQQILNSHLWSSWVGYTFETICYKHIAQISEALGLSPLALPGTWRFTSYKSSQSLGAQIDLLFNREDDSITICEIKYTDLPFVIDKSYANQLQRKLEVFRDTTSTKKQLFLSFISANGVKKNMYSEELVNQTVTLADLFKKL